MASASDRARAQRRLARELRAGRTGIEKYGRQYRQAVNRGDEQRLGNKLLGDGRRFRDLPRYHAPTMRANLKRMTPAERAEALRGSAQDFRDRGSRGGTDPDSPFKYHKTSQHVLDAMGAA